MAGFGSTIQSEFRRGSTTLRLILVNVAIFLLINIGIIISTLMLWKSAFVPMGAGSVFVGEYWLAATSNLELLMYKPWSVFTYMFLHADLFHIFFNMLILYFTGRIFVQFVGEKKLLNTYILGGLAGALLYIATQNIFPLLRELTPAGGDIMLGASASVMAVFVGAATYAPNLEVFLFGLIRLKLKWIALFYVLLDATSLGAMDGVAHFAHLGGAIWGFFSVRALKQGKDISAWFDRIIDFFANLGKPKSRLKVKYSSGRTSYKQAQTPPPRNDYDYNAQKAAKQKQIDKILDKISKSGYDSLTKEEKAFLFNESKNGR